jgi:hypothetical protein
MFGFSGAQKTESLEPRYERFYAGQKMVCCVIRD